MLWFEEAGVELAMILATTVAGVILVWAVSTMLVRWLRYARAQRLTAAEPAPPRTSASRQTHHDA